MADSPVRPASAEEEELARQHFDVSLSYEEWAAHHVHKFAMFSFHERRYADTTLNEWIRGLAEWLFAPGLSDRVRAAREKYLEPAEIAEHEAYERDPF